MTVRLPLFNIAPGPAVARDALAPRELASKVFRKDRCTCRFCGVPIAPICDPPIARSGAANDLTFPEVAYQQCQDAAAAKLAAVTSYYRAVKLEPGVPGLQSGDDYATACSICFSQMALSTTGAKNGALVIWCPELTQPEINALCTVIFDAVFAQREEAPLAESFYNALYDRADAIEQEWGKGASQALLWAKHMAGMSAAERVNRFSALRGIRFLPVAQYVQGYIAAREALAHAMQKDTDILRIQWDDLLHQPSLFDDDDGPDDEHAPGMREVSAAGAATAAIHGINVDGMHFPDSSEQVLEDN